MVTRCPGCGGAVPEDAKRCPQCHREFVPHEAAPPAEMGFSVPVLPPLQGGLAPTAKPASPPPALPAAAAPEPPTPAPMEQKPPAQTPNVSAADFWSGEGTKARVVPQRRRRVLPVLPEKLLLKIAVAVTAAVLLIAAYFALR